MRRLAAAALLAPVLAIGQVNLNFAEGRPGAPPAGWFVIDPLMRGFTASWQRQGCRTESPCALLAAPAGSAEDSSGSMLQSFPAAPFQGKTVSLRAWIRLEKKAPADHAQMLLHVGRPNLQPGFANNMADRPIVSEQWAQYEIQGEVARDADTIQIGISIYGSGQVWVEGVEFGAVSTAVAGPAVDAARQAIGQLYTRMDSAFARGDVKQMATLIQPGAQMGVGTIREPLLPAIQAEIAKGQKLTAHSEIASVRLDGDDAIVMVRREAQDPQSAGERTVVTSHRDTWVRAADGWRWRESIEVSYHWVLPPTTAEAARPVVEELKKRAVAAGSGELAAFGAAVGEARIVALGEAARGTREFAQLKEKLADYLCAHKGFTILAAGKDAGLQGLSDRLRVDFVALDEVTADAVAHLANVEHPQAKIVLWTDNQHARDPQLRARLGRKLYALGFAFDRGEVRAVGVEKGESKGLGNYRAESSPEGSGDAVLAASGMPQFFLNMAKLPSGALAHWLADLHLFHDLSAYWVIDDPLASLQPEQLGLCYDGLYYVEEVHSGG